MRIGRDQCAVCVRKPGHNVNDGLIERPSFWRRQAADPGVAATQVAGSWLVTQMLTRHPAASEHHTPHDFGVTVVTRRRRRRRVGSRLDGQMSSSTQSPQRGDRARHTLRPWRIIRRLNRPRSAAGRYAVELVLDLDRVGVFGQPEPARQPADVGVDGKAREVERHAAHDVGRLAPNSGQRHEVFQS